MAQGCILPISVTDNERMRASLREPLAQQAIWSSERALKQQDAVAYAKAVTYPLIDPKHPAHEGFVQTLLRSVAGNQSIQKHYRDALPLALTIVAQQTPDVTGLVHGSGRGSTALSRNLAHKTLGDAFAYELMGTAELIRLNRVEGQGSAPVNDGPNLRIWDNDRLDLGVRMPARHGGTETSEDLFLPAGTRSNKYRHSCEADAFLFRGDHAVGIDFKHARDSGSYAGHTSKMQSQLEAIANGIMADDAFNLREFHFVTNGVFDSKFVKAVAHVNERITEVTGDRPPIALHEGLQFPLG